MSNKYKIINGLKGKEYKVFFNTGREQEYGKNVKEKVASGHDSALDK